MQKKTARGLNNVWVTVILVVVGALGTVFKGFVKGVRTVGELMKNRDHSEYKIIEIGQNTERERQTDRESSGDQRRLAVNLVRKTPEV